MKRDPTDCSFYRFNISLAKRMRWLQILAIDISLVKPNIRVCARHFPLVMPQKTHRLTWIKDLFHPLKGSCQEQREQRQEKVLRTYVAVLMSTSTDASNSKTNSTVVTPIVEDHFEDVESSEVVVSSFTTAVGEQLCTEYQVHKLPSDSDDHLSDSLSTSVM